MKTIKPLLIIVAALPRLLCGAEAAPPVPISVMTSPKPSTEAIPTAMSDATDSTLSPSPTDFAGPRAETTTPSSLESSSEFENSLESLPSVTPPPKILTPEGAPFTIMITPPPEGERITTPTPHLERPKPKPRPLSERERYAAYQMRMKYDAYLTRAYIKQGNIGLAVNTICQLSALIQEMGFKTEMSDLQIVEDLIAELTPVAFAAIQAADKAGGPMKVAQILEVLNVGYESPCTQIQDLHNLLYDSYVEAVFQREGLKPKKEKM